MKIFRHTATPPVAAVSIYTGTDELFKPATIVAFGRGRKVTGGGTVDWDNDNDTVARRWGINELNATYPTGSYAYDTLDSGSGMFQKISGTWYLNGLATSVTTTDSSTFGTDITTAPSPQPPRPGLVGDSNYFVRVGSYNTQIPNLIPEPSAGAWLVLLLPFGFRRKR